MYCSHEMLGISLAEVANHYNSSKELCLLVNNYVLYIQSLIDLVFPSEAIQSEVT
jgi:hypothetical protein